VIYADFEAITQKINNCQPNDKNSFSEKYQKHKDCGYGYILVCCYDDKYSKPIQVYRSENSVYKFLEAMLEEVKYCNKTFKNHFNQPMLFTSEDNQKLRSATKCHRCEQNFIKGDKVVRDHDHVTSAFRQATHEVYNLNYSLTEKIPVIFHNLRGCDSHFIMEKIG